MRLKHHFAKAVAEKAEQKRKRHRAFDAWVKLCCGFIAAGALAMSLPGWQALQEITHHAGGSFMLFLTAFACLVCGGWLSNRIAAPSK